MKERKLLLTISILMLLTALPLAWFTFSLLEPYHYISGAEPGKPVEMPEIPRNQELQNIGRFLGSGLYLLTILAGISGIAEHKRERCRVSEVFAVLLIVGMIVCMFLTRGTALFAVLILAAETILYGIGTRKL